ncbi:MAG TPA: branched-chain amino acid ABC transporter permease [bacterium]|nr:branched-chain amino acid ABC transporter permease [bacterium]
MVVQGIITGIIIGGILSLPVMGVALIYGVTGILNYAIATVGVFGAFVVWQLLPYGILPAILGGILTSFLIGYGLQQFLLNPLIKRKGNDLTLFFIITFGIATILSGLIKVLFPRPTISFEFQSLGILHIASIAVSINRVIAIATAVGILLLMHFFEKTTKTGKSWVGTSQNLKMAKLVGVNVEFVFSLVSAIGCTLGFIGAFFWGTLYNLTLTTGWDLCFLGYIIAIVGGIGNIWGGMISALIMGIIISFTGYWLSGMWQSVLLYGIFFLVLVISPKGILGSERSI